MVAVHGGARRRGDHRPLGVHARAPTASTELFGGVDKPGTSGLAFLAGNVRDTDFEEPVFHSTRMFEKGGVTVAVIGQAFPYTPIANPRWMMPDWSFGIREEEVRAVGCGRAPPGARRWWCCSRTTASTSTASSRRASRAST